MRSEERPVIAFVVTLVGGAATLLAGVVVEVGSGAILSLGQYALGDAVGAVGFLWIFYGLVTTALAIGLYRNPDSHTLYGIGIVIFEVIGLLLGVVFLPGVVLAFVGGILAIGYRSSVFLAGHAGAGGRLSTRPMRDCPYCGTAAPVGTSICPGCVRHLEPFGP